MTHRFSFQKSISFVQTVAVTVCIFASVPFWGVAQEVETTTSPADDTAVTTTAPTTSPTQEDSGLTEQDVASVQSLQQQRLQLQQQAAQLQEAREYYTDTLDGLLQQKESIEQEIALKQREIDINAQLMDSLQQQINQTDEQLMQREQALLVRRQAILEQFEALRQRLRSLSKSGRLTTVQMLLSSDSYAGYLINSKMAARLTAMDEETLNGLEDELDQIQTERTMLTRQQQQLEADLEPFANAEQLLESNKTELLALLAQATQITDQLNQNLTYYRQQYLALSQQQYDLQHQINEILQNFSATDMVAPAIMSWPAPECTIITSSYKARWGRWHYGVDMASWGDSTGKTVVAAADGVVIFSGSDDSGYGHYVMIDHGFDISGQRIITLYGHNSALYVQEGDIVFGGQTVIAAVGNTGNSTGPHLHFEVRVDGTAVDPIAEGYLSTAGITISD